MKTFNHDTVELPELKTKNIDKKRFYLTPDGNEYPSITTVLSVRNKEALFEWRKRVGNEVANHVSRQAMTRGTKVHHMCEDFLNNEFDINKAKKDFLPYCLFTRLAEEVLCKIDMIKSQECGLYSDKYKVAGRVDCIAEYDGGLAVIDFKTSKKIKPEEWIEQYFVQEVAYACMYYELTGIPVQKLITIMVTPSGEVHVYDKRNKGDYIKLLVKYVKNFIENRMVVNG